MAATGGRWGGGTNGEPPVQYHMSDDEEDKAIYARADRPQSPTSPGRYSHSPTPAVPDDVDLYDDDGGASGYSSSDDEAWLDNCVYEDDPPDPAGARRQAEEFAGYALHHYNGDPNNVVKYDLVEATHNNYILVGYAHVNFVARPRGGGGKERLFFAELHQQLRRDTMVPTCLRSLDSDDDRVGGLDGEPWEDHVRAEGEGGRYCFACHGALKHPKDGSCYKAGHRDQLPWT